MNKKLNNKYSHNKNIQNNNNFFFRVWGARGSTPIPGEKTKKYGGNTSCLEIQCGNKIIIMDCGTGFRELGNYLLKYMPIKIEIFLTHVHWDHIQGFPFFKPAYIKGNSINVYGNKNLNIKNILQRQMFAPNFPVSIDTMQSGINYIDLNNKGKLFLENDINIEYDQLDHPNGCTAFKITYKNHSIVYATDTEHKSKLNYNLINFSKNADFLIYDAQYTTEEYIGTKENSKKGWGHSTWEEGIKIAKMSNTKNIILWHHDPDHNDEFVLNIELNAQKQFPKSYAAYEGMKINLI